MIALFFIPGNVFSPHSRPDTHNFSNKHKNIPHRLKTKAQRPDIIIGVGWVLWLCLRSQSWPEETAGRSVSVDGQKRKKKEKVRGQQQLSSLSINHLTWGRSGCWDSNWQDGWITEQLYSAKIYIWTVFFIFFLTDCQESATQTLTSPHKLSHFFLSC